MPRACFPPLLLPWQGATARLRLPPWKLTLEGTVGRVSTKKRRWFCCSDNGSYWTCRCDDPTPPGSTHTPRPDPLACGVRVGIVAELVIASPRVSQLCPLSGISWGCFRCDCPLSGFGWGLFSLFCAPSPMFALLCIVRGMKNGWKHVPRRVGRSDTLVRWWSYVARGIDKEN